ncbi:MAG: HPr(Ser) kinase/phosphatase [Candidatus Poribacteria bacterium]|nr:HPr(Ser) kinase/phosphatase [Candidatus Poribacteria bacterium]
MPNRMTVRQLIKYAGYELQLETAAGHNGIDRGIKTAESNRPGLALCGHYEHFGHDRVQILGYGEISYLDSLSPAAQADVLETLFSYSIPCVVVTSNLSLPSELIAAGNRENIPILTTRLSSAVFTTRLLLFLENEFGPSEYVHGNLVDVLGVGVLILGGSGIGKSECALELLQKGHRLIADDTVLLKRVSGHRVFGIRVQPIKHYMEVRGLGIIDVIALFGVTAVGDRKQVELVVTLELWDETKVYNRTGLDDDVYGFHNEDIPHVLIPVRPGRNIANLIEVAAMNLWGQKLGFHAAKDLDQVLIEKMQDQKDETAIDEWQHETLHPEILHPRRSKII